MNDINRAADLIYDAYRQITPINPLRNHFRDPAPETAYEIQEINTKRWLVEGQKITGRKIGLTSKAVQQQLGFDQPDYGMLFNSMAAPNGGEIKFSSVCQPRIEGEVAFIMASDLLCESVSMERLCSSIDCAVASFEIVGSRIKDWDISLFDTIADNASSGKYVLGGDKIGIANIDLEKCQMVLTENGELVSSGDGAACLGNPLNAALWLAQKMVDVGRPLKAGDVVLSGALGPFISVKPGAQYELAISQIGAATVTFSES